MADSSNPAQERIEILERPYADDRCYRITMLPNKLEAALVHDYGIDRIVVTVSVNLGEFDQENDILGTSHAVSDALKKSFEHYLELVGVRGGFKSTITYTSTVYTFHLPCPATASGANEKPCIKPSVRDLLEHLSSDFTSLFSQHNAKDHEEEQPRESQEPKSQDADRDLALLFWSLTNPEHPGYRSSTAEQKTLSHIALRQRSGYSANQMKLVILAHEPLDVLESCVRDTFGQLLNRNLPKRLSVTPFYTEKELLIESFVETTVEMPTLELMFPYHDECSSDSSKYLCHVIDRECSGSISAFFKARNWAQKLTAKAYAPYAGSSLFQINVTLTIDGLMNHEEIVRSIFQYLSMLKEQGPQDCIMDELSRVTQRDFALMEKTFPSRATQDLAKAMEGCYDRYRLLSGPAVFQKFDPKLFSVSMSYLRPDNFNLWLRGRNLPDHLKGTEKWHSMIYRSSKISARFVEMAQRAFEDKERPAELHLDLCNTSTSSFLNNSEKAPQLLRSNDDCSVWWRNDDSMGVAKAKACLRILVPHSLPIAQAVITSILFGPMAHDQISWISHGRIGIEVEGPRDMIHIFLRDNLLKLRNTEVREDQFRITRDNLLAEAQQYHKTNVGDQASKYLEPFKCHDEITHEDAIDALENMTVEQFRHFQSQILNHSQVEILAVGDLHEEHAIKIAKSASITHRTPAKVAREDLSWSAGSNYCFQPNCTSAELEGCVAYALSVGPTDDINVRAQLRLIGKLLNEPFAQYLDDSFQREFGPPPYRATTWGTTFRNGSAFCQSRIRSERACWAMESDFEGFLISFETKLHDMSEAEFTHRKDKASDMIHEEMVNDALSIFGRFLRHDVGEADWFLQDSPNTIVDLIKTVPKRDIEAFYSRFFAPASPHRAKLSVHINSQTELENGLVRFSIENADGESQVGSSYDELSPKTRSLPVIIQSVSMWKTGMLQMKP